MHVVSRKPFRDAAELHPNSRIAIDDCYRVLKQGNFKNPDELRQVFPSLDNFKDRDRWWVIDISGDHLRLMAFIDFSRNDIYVKHIVTHAEYDKLNKKYREEKEVQKPKNKGKKKSRAKSATAKKRNRRKNK